MRLLTYLRNPKTITLLLLAVLLLFLVAEYVLTPVQAAQLGSREWKMGDSTAGASIEALLSFNLVTAGTLGSVDVQFCDNDPFPGNPCNPPAGFDISQAVLGNQTGPGAFSIAAGASANDLVLTRPPAVAAAGPASFDFTGVINPSSAGSYFVRLQTYASADASGSAIDYGGIAFAITNSVSVNATVPPYLIFCTGVTIGSLNCANAVGDFIDFGNLSFTSPRSGTSQMLVATNALQGYNVTISGNTMASGNNIINALAANDISRPGTSQFGLNLRANATPAVGSDPAGPGTGVPSPSYNLPNFFRFDTNEIVASSPSIEDARKYTSSYIVNVPNLQAPGVYVTTITYIALATF